MTLLTRTLAAAFIAGGASSLAGPTGAVPLAASLSLRDASTPAHETVRWRGWGVGLGLGLAAGAIFAATRPYYAYGYGGYYPAYYGYGGYYSSNSPAYGYNYAPGYGYGYAYAPAYAYPYPYAYPYAYGYPRLRAGVYGRPYRAWRRW
jgi:hypothetical protein